jgi:spermidine synthase
MNNARLPLTILIAFVSGYVSLSYEILWYRTFAYAMSGASPVFSLLLAAFLAGIALGSRRAKALCKAEKDRAEYLARLSWLLLGATVVSFLVVPILGFAATVTWQPVLLLVIVGAGLMGAVLPVLAQFGIDPDGRAGYHLALVYIGNIAGSALGSLLTGFVLMEHLPTRTIAMVLVTLGFLAAFGVTLITPGDPGKRVRLRIGSISAMGVTLAWLGQGVLFGTLYERLQYQRAYTDNHTFKYLVENRHGIIAVGKDDTIYGGGVYDGAFNVRLGSNQNNIHRAFAIDALRSSNPRARALRDILMVGLSSGSWAQIVANLPSTRSLTIVEINPGYLELIRKYPAVATLLENPKVKIEIDDGRRWLRRQPNAKFDFVVANTTFSWRAHATNLLSVEFLELVRAHMPPWGIHYFNTTWSADVLRTAITTFPNAMRVMNFVAVSDSPFTFDRAAWERALIDTRIDGHGPIDIEADKALFEKLCLFGGSLSDPDTTKGDRLEGRDTMLARWGRGPLITDDNMLSEVRPLLPFGPSETMDDR